MAKQRIDEAALVGAIVIVLIHDDLRRVDAVHPGGDIGIVLAFTGDGIHQHRTLDIGTAKEPDALDNAGANPVGRTLLIDLKGRFIEDIGGILEPQMAVQIAAEVLSRSIVHPFRQTNHIYLLRHHINDEIGRQAGAAVIEPLEDIAVAQRGDPNGTTLVIDLGIVIRYLKLAYHIGQLAQFAVTQLFGRIPVQHGDLIKGDLLDILGKVTGLHSYQLGIGAAADDNAGKQPANHIDDKYCSDNDKRHDAAALQQFPEGLAVFRLAIDAGSDNRRDAVYYREEQEKAIKCCRVQIDGRQLHIKVNETRHNGDDQIDENVFAGKAGFSHKRRSFRTLH